MDPFIATSALFEAAFREHERIFQSLRERANEVWDHKVDRKPPPDAIRRAHDTSFRSLNARSRDETRVIAPVNPKLSHWAPGVKRQDTLAREGIKPSASSCRTTTSTNSRKFAASDSDRFSTKRSLPAGWNEVGECSNGTLVVRGLQSIIESMKDTAAFYVYEPKLRENKKACMSSPANFVLSAQFKLIPESQNLINVVIGYRDCSDYYILHIDILQHTLSLFHCNEVVSSLQRLLSSKSLYCQSFTLKHSLLVNRFYSYKVAVNGSKLTLSINDNEIFAYDGDLSKSDHSLPRGLDGLTGLLCLKGNKLFFKEWQVRASSDGKDEKITSNDSSLLEHVTSSSAEKTEGQSQLHQSAVVVTKHDGKQESSVRERLKFLKHDKDIIEAIVADIIIKDIGVNFDDIVALADAKRVLNEAVVLPLLMPELFMGMREPWKGILLFGPPGTGKTMLAKAIASSNSCTFFNCSAATLVSKWRGDSEKLIKCLFDAARACAPSIIFIDEIDGLVSKRGSEGEHEASRRMKSEILSQMDGIASSMNKKRVTVLATTNSPWELDVALLRRLEKRIYIPLPDLTARRQHFEHAVKSFTQMEKSELALSAQDIEALANATEGLSGADITSICKEASMAPVRRLLAHSSIAEIQNQQTNGTLQMSPITMVDFQEAINKIKPSVGKSKLGDYESWNAMHGSN